jgi:hypothetical protein
MQLTTTSRGKYQGPTANFVPEGEALPAEVEKRGSVGCGVVLFLLALACLGAAVLEGMDPGYDVGELPIFLIGFLVGLVLFAVLGLLTLQYREHWTLTAKFVQRRWRRIGNWKEWTTPLSDYAGVLMYDVHHSGGKNSSSYTEYILDLHHPDDKKKTLRLWCCRSYERHRAEWERYARLLDLPALLKTPDGIEQREVDDLDKSVRERIAEGSMELTFDASTHPPGDKLSVSVEGDGLLITTRGGLGKAFKVVPVIFVLTAAGMIAGGIFALSPASIILPITGCFFLLMSMGLAFAARTFGQYLRVSPAGVRTWWTHPWGRFAEKMLPSQEIEEVVVRTPPGSQGFKAVVVIADSGVAWWGMGLSQEELEWVRDCIVTVISA